MQDAGCTTRGAISKKQRTEIMQSQNKKDQLQKELMPETETKNYLKNNLKSSQYPPPSIIIQTYLNFPIGKFRYCSTDGNKYTGNGKDSTVCR